MMHGQKNIKLSILRFERKIESSFKLDIRHLGIFIAVVFS